MRVVKNLIIAATLVACAGGTAALGGDDRVPAAQQELLQAFPGVRLHQDAGRTRIIYGKSMTTARTPELAAERWLADHGDAFGSGRLELVQTSVAELRDGEFVVFMYSQTIGGVPVELSPGRVLVHNNGDGTWSVVYAAGLFVAHPEGGFGPMPHTSQDAINFVRKTTQYGGLPMWSGAELVIYQLETETGFEGVRAWKFVGENPDLVNREKFTFFIDAATGGLLEARDEVLNIDVFGFVKGYATPGNKPDTGSNSPVLLPINDATVSVSGGNSAFSDPTGFFNIAHGGSSNVTINANFDTGHWADVDDKSGGSTLSASATATPGSEAYLEFNSSPSAFTTAQVNGFINTGLIHNLFTDRSSWTGMDFRCKVNVNLANTCNAFFDGGSINFFRAGGGCPNSAYSTVVAHEYGHYVVNKLNLGQGSFGEGYGDVCAEMLYDTPIIAEDFFGTGNPIRNNSGNISYPCGGAIHFCGQVLGGVWWHTRENFGTTYGSAAGLELARQRMVDWSLVTTGGSGNNSAHPGTAIEVLIIDDDDGNIDNGTPNYDDICSAFSRHNIDCPEVRPIIFSYPGGLPQLLTPGQSTDFDVMIEANGAVPVPSTAAIWFWVDGGGLTAGSMSHNGGDSYTATLGAVDCTSVVTYFLQIEGEDNNTYYDPRTGSYEAQAFDSLDVAFADNFQTNMGWTVTGNASSGQWERGVPVNGNRGDPGNDHDGSGMCYVTQNVAGDSDVDDGSTTLTSPVMDATGGGSLNYAFWLNDVPNGELGVEDGLLVEIATNAGGTNWTTAHDYGTASNSWRTDSITVPDTATLRVRFTASDNSPGDVVECGIDAVELVIGICNDCVADFNGDGTVNTLDVLAFLNAWAAGDSSADINGDGEVNTLDVLAYLNLWNAGC